MRQRRRTRLLAYFLITLLTMIQTIWHMFEGVRPFDWLMLAIEAAVLLLILYEIIMDALRRRAESKYRRFIDAQVLTLSQRLIRAERLQSVVPNSFSQPPGSPVAAREQEWIRDVQAWIEETKSFLMERSPKASAEFMSLTGAGPINTYIGDTPHGFVLRGTPASVYTSLSIHLDNLRRIVSRPEAYFE